MSVLKEEFQIKNFGFTFPKAEVFYTAQWPWHPLVFVIYRTVWGLYHLAALIYSISIPQEKPYPVFLTNWTYMLQTVTFNFAAGTALVEYIKRQRSVAESLEMAGTSCRKEELADSETGPPERTTRLPWHLAISWLLFSILDVIALLVSVVYFALLYPLRKKPIGYDGINIHAVNSFSVLLDILVSARPKRLLHVIYPMAFGAGYAVFNVIYWSFDKKNNVVYSVLDWNKPSGALAIVFGLVLAAVPLVVFLQFGLYQLRLFIYKKVYTNSF